MALTLILGNQLHREWLEPSPLLLQGGSPVVMIEDLGVATTFRYHKLRLLHTFVAMRRFRDALASAGMDVRYHELEASQQVSFEERLALELETTVGAGAEPVLRVAEIPDPAFQVSLESFCRERSVRLEVLPSPAFLSSAAESRATFSEGGRPFMKTFYERQRRRLEVLIEADGGPSGGRWSFDSENRRKLPKGYRQPALPRLQPSGHEREVRPLIDSHFAGHPGQMGELYVPSDHTGAQEWLQTFLETRLEQFGPYEDALSADHDTLQHSLLSPLLNIGLLSPAEVVSRTLAHAAEHPVPIASLEGFLRQVIGWREFVRGIDLVYGERQAQANFWGHRRRLNPCWDDGSTGLPPLDRAIEKLDRLAYNHHIERLMVISNLMLLCEIEPREVYRWFMERYLDSYAWVMGPNVYGMGLMSDGGIFSTKPYICGSNYILKMGGGPKGPWCEIWDGLYWRFIGRHREVFRSQPRLSMMVAQLDRMDAARRERILALAEAFIERVSVAPG